MDYVFHAIRDRMHRELMDSLTNSSNTACRAKKGERERESERDNREQSCFEYLVQQIPLNIGREGRREGEGEGEG